MYGKASPENTNFSSKEFIDFQPEQMGGMSVHLRIKSGICPLTWHHHVSFPHVTEFCFQLLWVKKKKALQQVILKRLIFALFN